MMVVAFVAPQWWLWSMDSSWQRVRRARTTWMDIQRKYDCSPGVTKSQSWVNWNCWSFFFFSFLRHRHTSSKIIIIEKQLKKIKFLLVHVPSQSKKNTGDCKTQHDDDDCSESASLSCKKQMKARNLSEELLLFTLYTSNVNSSVVIKPTSHGICVRLWTSGS